MVEILALRDRFAPLMALLLWAHVPLIALVSWHLGQPVALPTGFAIALALAYQMSWLLAKAAPATRYISAVALMGEPALLVYLLRDNPWQIDMHMYFFACLALLIAWCDWRVIALASVAIMLHHLVLDLLLPYAVFPNGADILRVVFHALVVFLEGSILGWICNRLVESFNRTAESVSQAERMSDEIRQHNETLEETIAERTKEAQAASEAKSLFLANMSHEIRTPMNAILGFSHLALRTNLSPQQRDYIIKIKTATSSLLNLVNDLLDFSKIEAGKLTLEKTSFNLRDTLESVRSLLAVRALEKNIEFQCIVSADTPEILVGDPLRLSQIISNLISNAIKFTDTGKVEFSVRPLRLEADSTTLAFAVMDTGIGMTSEQTQHLFTAFTQADTSMTRRFGGTGLGLSISKQLVEMMDGTFYVASEAGVGSTFTFTAHFGLAPTTSVSALPPPPLYNKLRVLIADDNAASREILTETLRPLFAKIDVVASGNEALDMLRAASTAGTPFDLVLLDWRMPGLDGIETVRRMRQDEAIPKMPTIMMVTAYSREEAIVNADAVGISAFLVKPISVDMIRDTLDHILPEAAVDPQVPATPDAVVMIAPPYRGAVILLVEDNEINRELAYEVLTDAGLVVETAENGRIACAKVATNPKRYDAILMDVQMPEMDGIEATQQIRRSLSASDLPIIAMTAHAYAQERQNCLDAGMNDHSAKPIDPARLVEKLERWLKPVAHRPDAGASQPPLRAAAASDDGLPATLPPFDLDVALARVNGRRKLLHKLIINFGNTFADVTNVLREQFGNEAWNEARRTAHTLKGTAGTLEVKKVAEAARQLEDALASRELDDLDRLLARLDEAMAPALAAARSLSLPATAAPGTPALPDAGTLDYAAVEAELNDLRVSLQKRSLKARKQFEAIEAKLGQSPEATRLEPVRQALAALDYPSALHHLEAITAGPASISEGIAS